MTVRRTDLIVIAALALLLGGIALMSHVITGGAPSHQHAILGALFITISAWPGIRLLLSSDRESSAFFPIASALIGFSYAAPLFIAAHFYPEPGPINHYGYIFVDLQTLFRLDALIFAMMGLIFFQAGYLLSRTQLVLSKLPRFPNLSLSSGLDIPQKFAIRRTGGLWILLLIHFAYISWPILGSVPSLAQFAQPAGLIAFGGFLYNILNKKLSRAEIFLFFTLMIIVLISHVANKSIYFILYFGIISFFIFWRHIGLKSISIIISLLVIFIALYPTLQNFRGASIPDVKVDIENMSIEETLQKYQSVFTHLITVALAPNALAQRSTNYDWRERHRGIFARLTLLPQLTLAMQKTPSEIPFWWGASYVPLLTSVIPRFLYPDKPREMLGLDFADRYWDIPREQGMSMNVPWLPELYLNFGALGVGLGMMFFGSLLGIIVSVFCHSAAGPIEYALGTTLLVPFVYPESNFSLMVGSFPLLILCVWFFFLSLNRLLKRE